MGTDEIGADEERNGTDLAGDLDALFGESDTNGAGEDTQIDPSSELKKLIQDLQGSTPFETRAKIWGDLIAEDVEADLAQMETKDVVVKIAAAVINNLVEMVDEVSGRRGVTDLANVVEGVNRQSIRKILADRVAGAMTSGTNPASDAADNESTDNGAAPAPAEVLDNLAEQVEARLRNKRSEHDVMIA